jgi:hypothetical protein
VYADNAGQVVTQNGKIKIIPPSSKKATKNLKDFFFTDGLGSLTFQGKKCSVMSENISSLLNAVGISKAVQQAVKDIGLTNQTLNTRYYKDKPMLRIPLKSMKDNKYYLMHLTLSEFYSIMSSMAGTYMNVDKGSN